MSSRPAFSYAAPTQSFSIRRQAMREQRGLSDIGDQDTILSDAIESQISLRNESVRELGNIQMLLSSIDDEESELEFTPRPSIQSPLAVPNAPIRAHQNTIFRPMRPISPPPVHAVHSIDYDSIESHNGSVRKFQNIIDSVSSGERIIMNDGDYLELSGLLGKMYIKAN